MSLNNDVVFTREAVLKDVRERGQADVAFVRLLVDYGNAMRALALAQARQALDEVTAKQVARRPWPQRALGSRPPSSP